VKVNIQINGRWIGPDFPVYFIADIAANHDGSFERARKLIRLAKEAGADAAKFQHFEARKIVSQYGFDTLGEVKSHQSSWEKSVSEVYEEASVPREWTEMLKQECDEVGITFFSSPYDFDAVDALDPHVPAFKIGSGDIDWLEQIEHVAKKGKPVIVASGASSIDEVKVAMKHLLKFNSEIILLQCNTNYTGNSDNLEHLHLNVISTFREMWPNIIVGLSDHTNEVAVVLGAVALGARVIERHFTDDTKRSGPDHHFALDPPSWHEMVVQTRLLESALGSSEKFISQNEMESVVVQRRCVRARRDLPAGHILDRDDIEVLRPATVGAIKPDDIQKLLGNTLSRDIKCGQDLRWEFLTARLDE
jgi:N-acetylneuraminate synthase